MPRRGENIHKRKDGRWEGRYKRNDEFGGMTKYGSVYGRTYSEVKAKLSEMKSNEPVRSSLKCRSKTFGEVLALWRSFHRLNHKGATDAKYEYMIQKHIIPELGSMKLTEITNAVINDFIFRKTTSGRLDGKGGLSPAYVRTIAVIIQSAIQFAVDEKMCAPINLKTIKPTVEKNELDVFSAKEQQQLEHLLLCDMDETKLGVFISLNTGLRIGEICALTWKDIDLTERIIHVRATVSRVKASPESEQQTKLIIDKPKTKTSLRDIPISTKLYPILQAMKEKATSAYVASDNCSFVSLRTYEYRFHKLLERCQLRSVNYHVLRHTFATRCIEVGVDVKTLSELLGHADVSITMNTYVHSSMELKRRQMEKLPAC